MSGRKIEFLSGDEFSAALDELGWSVLDAARFMSQRRERILEWLNGDQAIPKGYVLFLVALTVPEAMAKVRAAEQLLNKRAHNQ